MIGVGVGYSSRCTAPELEALVTKVLVQVEAAGWQGDGGMLATLERKRADGLLEVVAGRLGLACRYLGEGELAAAQPGTRPSDRAARAVGQASVAEAAALAAAGPSARLLVGKTASALATCAAAGPC